MYNERVWLNKDTPRFTNNMVCFDGVIEFEKNRGEETSFIEIANCHHKIRLHIDYQDTMEDHISKIDLIIDELIRYTEYLKFNTTKKEK